MKVRESGMPDEEMWKSFFSPENILKTLWLSDSIKDVVEFGCGYGTFTIPAAKIIRGNVFAFDIEPEMISITKNKAKSENLKNLEFFKRDFMEKGTGLEPESVSYAMVFNILHTKYPSDLLIEANRVLEIGGLLSIIHWNYDETTPRGPSMEMRPTPEQIKGWTNAVGFKLEAFYDLKPHHYGFVFRKN